MIKETTEWLQERDIIWRGSITDLETDVRAAIAAELKKQEQWQHAFNNLIARIDRDGGHAQDGHTLEENLARGDSIVCEDRRILGELHHAAKELCLAHDWDMKTEDEYAKKLVEVVDAVESGKDAALWSVVVECFSKTSARAVFAVEHQSFTLAQLSEDSEAINYCQLIAKCFIGVMKKLGLSHLQTPPPPLDGELPDVDPCPKYDGVHRRIRKES